MMPVAGSRRMATRIDCVSRILRKSFRHLSMEKMSKGMPVSFGIRIF